MSTNLIKVRRVKNKKMLKKEYREMLNVDIFQLTFWF